MTTNKRLKELKKYMDIYKYDINQRVSMIIDEVQEQLKDMERKANGTCPEDVLEKKLKKVSEMP